MRLLHPRTLEIIAKADNKIFKNATVSKKQIISHAWSEVLKYLAQDKSHPKMFFNNEDEYHIYLHYIYALNKIKNVGCNLDFEKINTKYIGVYDNTHIINKFFNNEYLFSDAVSLYFKGVNIFPKIYGDEWRRYVPIENLEEIFRVVGKTLFDYTNIKKDLKIKKRGESDSKSNDW